MARVLRQTFLAKLPVDLVTTAIFHIKICRNNSVEGISHESKFEVLCKISFVFELGQVSMTKGVLDFVLVVTDFIVALELGQTK